MRSKNSNFGRGGAYCCKVCGRSTRETGGGESGVNLCYDCYELCGFENMVLDGDAEEVNPAEISALIKSIEDKGGNASEWKSGPLKEVLA